MLFVLSEFLSKPDEVEYGEIVPLTLYNETEVDHLFTIQDVSLINPSKQKSLI